MHTLLKDFATFLLIKMHYLQTETLQGGQLANLAGLVFIYAILIQFYDDGTMLNSIISRV